MPTRPQPCSPDDFWDRELSEADLTPEELEDIRASEEDIAAGRTFSHEEFKAMFAPIRKKLAAGIYDPADFEALEERLRRR
ncbi:MAG TPA: hypothetical protein VD978_09330 [Azospirillum sp.]|nr:hypothetical protein [Azospirillum sp.]